MILAGRSVHVGMGNSPGECLNCVKKACLKNCDGYYYRITNTPSQSALAGRLVYITKEMIFFILQELQALLPDRPAFEILNLYTGEGICPWMIRDPFAEALFEKHFYCKEFNTSPYPDYDQTPAWWRQAVIVLTNETNLCLKSWEKKPDATTNLESHGQHRRKEQGPGWSSKSREGPQ